ncbi:MAG: UvrD-helicase domain-containing protein [Planctomycetes bacterium]|nr:UvrD-helicase domain-containing protein [Planctomycetota bacterium]
MFQSISQVPFSKNKVIIACAGSGKTTRLVLDAIASPDRRIAFATFTINNTNGIIKRFGERYGGVPKHVDVMTWFGFLLREGARPYQHALYPDKRIESIFFVQGQSPYWYGEHDIARHYFASGDFIYTDKISKFIVRCNEESNGKVIQRLQQVYTDLFIDECQDLAGPDLDFIELLLQSEIRVTLVGDPCQAVLSTNLSRKNQKYRKSGVTELFERWENNGLCKIETMNKTHRCNSDICNFVNALWPEIEDMSAISNDQTGHDGIFLVGENQVDVYIQKFSPQVLKHGKRKKAPEYERTGLNFGVAKGMECDRVLIVPTGPIKNYLKNGDLSVLKSKEKLHVAVTRAKHSVAFVYNGNSELTVARWEQS